MTAIAVAVGFKAHLGWLSAVALTLNPETPEPVLTTRLDLFTDQPRDIREPFHVAGGWDGLRRVKPADDPVRLIRRSRKQQDALTFGRLEQFRSELRRSGYDWVRTVVLTGRGNAGAGLDDALRSHARIHIAEGDAVREACRTACRRLQLRSDDQDEKSAAALACALLGCTAAALDGLLQARRPAAATSWAKEQRLISTATWVAIRG